MSGEEASPRVEARIEGRVISHGSIRRRRTFSWRNYFRRAPRVAEQPGCPLRVVGPRFYSHASLGSQVWTTLRFTLHNTGDRDIHSYFWRHASPVLYANGGGGSHPENGLAPGACQQEAAHQSWRGPQTITIDFVQITDGGVWFSSDPQSLVTSDTLDVGTRAAGDHLLQVWREGGMPALAAALPMIRFDLRDHPASVLDKDGGAAGKMGFYAGLTRAVVMMNRVSDQDVEATLLALRATGLQSSG